MKLPTGLLLSVIIGAASAASDANVYIFQGDKLPSTSHPPMLSPEEARLVFAQRLGVSQYHGLGDASEKTLSHINKFGGNRESVFQYLEQDKAAELLLVVEGVSSKYAEPLLSAWSSITPAFTVSSPPSAKANLKLVQDLLMQVGGPSLDCALEDAINPFNERCWSGKSNAIHMHLGAGEGHGIEDLMAAQERITRFATNQEMNVIVVLMPESSLSVKSQSQPYGSYDMPSRTQLSGRQAEEPMAEVPETSSPPLAFNSKQVTGSNLRQDPEPITGVPPRCHSSLESCISATNNCSGHGECYSKYGSANDTSTSCYACGCAPTEETFLVGDKKGFKITYWGGAACQKKDVSGPFWLFAIFTVVMVGVVSWAVGLLYSVGEEKLPGVIGAGVSSKAR